jgi:hypothetical protein
MFSQDPVACRQIYQRPGRARRLLFVGIEKRFAEFLF